VIKQLGLILCLILPLGASGIPSQKSDSGLSEVLQLPIPNALKVLRNQQQHLPELSKIAFDSNEEMDRRWRALSVLIQLRPSNIDSLIQRSLSAPEWYMRNLGLLGLQDISPRNALEAAIRLLSDRAMVVRSAAVQVLEKQVGRQEVRDSLWEEMRQQRNFRKGTSLWIRSQIAEILARDPVRSERAQFTALVQEQDQKIQQAAFLGLEKITGQRIGKATDSHSKKLEQWRIWAARQSTETKVR
jgi:HEAT repeat protein